MENNNIEVDAENKISSKIFHINKEKYPQLAFYHQKCGDIVEHTYFQAFIMTLIIINALTMGLATYPAVRFNPRAQSIFDNIDFIFLLIFTIELALNFIYHGIYLFLNGWLVFDFFVVMSSWFFSSLKVIRTFRIFRSLRLIGRIPSLRKLIDALFDIVPDLLVICLFLAINFYIFGVLFTQLFMNLYSEGYSTWDYFSRLDITLFSLFQMMTLNDWSPIARDAMAMYGWAWIPFIAFVILQSFIMMNMIIAALCNSMTIIRENEELEKAKESEGNNIESDVDNLQKQVDSMTQTVLNIIGKFENDGNLGKELVPLENEKKFKEAE